MSDRSFWASGDIVVGMVLYQSCSLAMAGAARIDEFKLFPGPANRT